jgi:hypothetical protein
VDGALPGASSPCRDSALPASVVRFRGFLPAFIGPRPSGEAHIPPLRLQYTNGTVNKSVKYTASLRKKLQKFFDFIL